MAGIRTLNQLVLAKLEATPGVDAAPTPADNAVLIETPASPADFRTFDTNEVTGSLDARSPIPTGGSRSSTGRVYITGSGTAGTAPRYKPLLEACGLQVKTLAADSTGTAQAGAASTITLAAGGPSSDLVGFVVETTGGTGSGQKRIITAYNGTTKVATVSPGWVAGGGVVPDNTTTYAVRKGNVFYLQSSVLPTVTIYRYQHFSTGGQSKLEKVLGAAGNVRTTLQVGQGCFFDFDFKGSLTAPSDGASPASPVYDTPRPAPFIDGQVFLNNSRAILNNFTMDLGNEVALEEDPNQAFGFGQAGITRRRVQGSFRLPKDLEANINVFDSWKNGTEYLMTALWGSVAGNRCAFMAKNMVFTGGSDADVEGFAYNEIPYRINGQDSGYFLCLW
jgi:hypothetical protein